MSTSATARAYGLLSRIGGDALSPRWGTAVKWYLADNDVEWTDWEDREEHGSIATSAGPALPPSTSRPCATRP